MKQRALALAIRKIIWAELALSTAIAIPAFAQSQPATPPAAASGTAAAAAPAAASGTAATKNVKQLQTFQVTGSLIRQADKTGFQQVQVITAKDIQQSGQQSVSDYMRNISANSANSWGEANADSFAAGGAGIALRGLSEKYTLVLVDGQRAAPFAFAVNGTDQFFDLNTLPLNIVDRIEVVKTGAVSQYGSDAIAGVVNIITKHNYRDWNSTAATAARRKAARVRRSSAFSVASAIWRRTVSTLRRPQATTRTTASRSLTVTPPKIRTTPAARLAAASRRRRTC